MQSELSLSALPTHDSDNSSLQSYCTGTTTSYSATFAASFISAPSSFPSSYFEPSGSSPADRSDGWAQPTACSPLLSGPVVPIGASAPTVRSSMPAVSAPVSQCVSTGAIEPMPHIKPATSVANQPRNLSASLPEPKASGSPPVPLPWPPTHNCPNTSAPQQVPSAADTSEEPLRTSVGGSGMAPQSTTAASSGAGHMTRTTPEGAVESGAGTRTDMGFDAKQDHAPCAAPHEVVCSTDSVVTGASNMSMWARGHECCSRMSPVSPPAGPFVPVPNTVAIPGCNPISSAAAPHYAPSATAPARHSSIDSFANAPDCRVGGSMATTTAPYSTDTNTFACMPDSIHSAPRSFPHTPLFLPGTETAASRCASGAPNAQWNLTGGRQQPLERMLQGTRRAAAGAGFMLPQPGLRARGHARPRAACRGLHADECGVMDNKALLEQLFEDPGPTSIRNSSLRGPVSEQGSFEDRRGLWGQGSWLAPLPLARDRPATAGLVTQMQSEEKEDSATGAWWLAPDHRQVPVAQHTPLATDGSRCPGDTCHTKAAHAETTREGLDEPWKQGSADVCGPGTRQQ
jgi:hypothetical protein